MMEDVHRAVPVELPDLNGIAPHWHSAVKIMCHLGCEYLGMARAYPPKGRKMFMPVFRPRPLLGCPKCPPGTCEVKPLEPRLPNDRRQGREVVYVHGGCVHCDQRGWKCPLEDEALVGC